MPLETTNKNIYGLGVGISTVFEIFSNFPFLGGGVNSMGHDLHTIECTLAQGTRIYTCTWFRGGDLNSFQDIQQYPIPGGGDEPRGHI
jgi:hypothetical protein